MAAEAPPITHKRVLAIAIPIVLSNATVPILGAVDAGVAGQLGEVAPIGGVGIGAVILSSLYWVFGFLRMGTTGLVAQARGGGHAGEVTALLTRALLIALAGGAALVLLQLPILWGAFQLVPASDEVEALARDYIRIRIWSAPAAIALYGIIGWLIGQERTRGVLYLQLWMNGLNIALDLWFVLGLGWGVKGVAAATLIAEVTALGFGLWLCRDAFAHPAWRDLARVADPARLAHMARTNMDILLRSLFLLAMFVSFSFFGAGLGDVTLAANQVLMQFLSITAFALDGFAFAAEAIVGAAFGAGSVAALRRGAILASVWGGVCVVAGALAFWVWGPWIIDLMATAPEVRAEARVYLLWMVAAPLLGVAAWMLDGVFIGATQTRAMRDMMFVALLIYVAAVIVFVPLWGNHGLWAALMVSFIARGGLLAIKYPALERAATTASR